MSVESDLYQQDVTEDRKNRPGSPEMHARWLALNAAAWAQTPRPEPSVSQATIDSLNAWAREHRPDL